TLNSESLHGGHCTSGLSCGLLLDGWHNNHVQPRTLDNTHRSPIEAVPEPHLRRLTSTSSLAAMGYTPAPTAYWRAILYQGDYNGCFKYRIIVRLAQHSSQPR